MTQNNFITDAKIFCEMLKLVATEVFQKHFLKLKSFKPVESSDDVTNGQKKKDIIIAVNYFLKTTKKIIFLSNQFNHSLNC